MFPNPNQNLNPAQGGFPADQPALQDAGIPANVGGQPAQAAAYLGAQILLGHVINGPVGPNEQFLAGIPLVNAPVPQVHNNQPPAPVANHPANNPFAVNFGQAPAQVFQADSPMLDSSDQTHLPPGSR